MTYSPWRGSKHVYDDELKCYVTADTYAPPMDYNSILKLGDLRERHGNYPLAYQRNLHTTDHLVTRLGLEAEMKGHTGCVNCLEFNYSGNLLASGSDDRHVIIWDPFKQKIIQDVPTQHNGNIFSVKFHMNDTNILSGAADNWIQKHDINSKKLTFFCNCSIGRVKRLAVSPSEPNLFWSCAEDGIIMQFDARTRHRCSNVHRKNVLISLSQHMGDSAEGKCIAVNPLKPELIAVGANDPYVRLYDRRMIKLTEQKYSRKVKESLFGPPSYMYERIISDVQNIPRDAVEYFVPGNLGHLPGKREEYNKRYIDLQTTYLAFSPDGSELLANLGGEQIYLFNIMKKRKKLIFDIYHFLQPKTSSEDSRTENHIFNREEITKALRETEPSSSPYTGKEGIANHHHKKYDELKKQADEARKSNELTTSINLYTKALLQFPKAAFLYSNRAAAFIRRQWYGDLYAAVRDCYEALKIFPSHMISHFRLCVALLDLGWLQEAVDVFQTCRMKYPDKMLLDEFRELDSRIKNACLEESRSEDSFSIRKLAEDMNKSDDGKTSCNEKYWRKNAYDYEARYCGRCNTTTDIMEANFLGSNGQYIVAGSDCTYFFIWDKAIGSVVKVLKGDSKVVNCLQPHPDTCLLATSGIDPLVRLWTPQSVKDKKTENENVDNVEEASQANQRRMNAEPLQVLLQSMGYNHIPGQDNMADETVQDDHPDTSTVQCPTS